ncbi:MAG: succinyl-CoA synthetase subunit beta, partial [Pseudomonadota bacterium]|nr:succinyl-CoA synthetase subunit beta [Pseudomonadota bacterium]
CDTIAEGIGVAIKRSSRAVPIVLRFAGNNAEFGRTLLKNYGVRFIEADSMNDAIEQAVEVAGGRAA